MELPTQAKYKEEDNSNVEKFKEFPVMYSHYGPTMDLKPFFLYYNNDSVHLQFLLFLNLINSLTGVFSGLQQKN